MVVGPPRWVEQYLSIPFVDHGDTFDGCHCWGLVRLVFRRQLGVELPAYAGISATDALPVARAMREGAASSPLWCRVESCAPFDVVLMTAHDQKNGGRYPGHVGVALGGDLLLHIEEGIDAMCVRADDPHISRRILSAHRYIGHVTTQ